MRLHLTTISFGTILILLILLARLVSAQSSPPVAAPPHTAASSPGAATPSQPSQGPATQPPAVLTDAEKIRLRTLQVALLRAQSARICGEIKDLASAPEYQAAQQADFEFRSAIDAIYTSRKLAATEYQICDGPGDGRSTVCAGLAKDELALRPLPPVAKAKP